MKRDYFNPKIKYLFALITFEGQQLTRGCGYRVGSPSPFITLRFSPPHRSQTFSSPLLGKNKIRKMEKSKDSSNHLYVSEKRPDRLIHCRGSLCASLSSYRKDRKETVTHKLFSGWQITKIQHIYSESPDCFPHPAAVSPVSCSDSHILQKWS